MEKLETGDVVLCTVDRIQGTIVFVKIQGNGEGSIITSEIAPGRIRNIRDYVVPKKQIVCKVLRISGDRIDLSLRRVTQKEQKEVLEKNKQERSCKSVLQSVLGEKAKEVISKISQTDSVYDFCEVIKTDLKPLEKLTSKENAKKIQDILKKQKQKKSIIKKEFLLHSENSKGISLIKEILGGITEAEIKYLSAGKYSIKKEAETPKKADSIIKEILSEIEKQAKKQDLIFSIKQR